MKRLLYKSNATTFAYRDGETSTQVGDLPTESGRAEKPENFKGFA